MSDATLNRFLSRGTAAQRAAFTPTPPTPASGPSPGYLWYETDTGLLYAYDGSAWDGIGGTVKIAEQTPSGTGTVTFSSLGAFTHLRLVYTARGTQVATATAFDGQLNGDTGANYDRQNSSNFATTATGAESLGQTVLNQIGIVAAASAPANVPGSGEIVIYDYRGTTFFKQLTSAYVFQQSTASGNTFKRSAGFQWRSVAAITSITMTLQSGNFVAGSKFSLYGMA